MRPNFEACGQEFLAHATDRYSQYIFNGTRYAPGSQSPLITVDGCKKLCGDGIEYYAWWVHSLWLFPLSCSEILIESRKDAANTITTWVLPIIGLIVQAPWESNQAWETTLALFRYLGSPISVLAYVLWNIKISGKAALMVDMAVKYDEYPPEGSQWSDMRDSMYILCVMNQCKHLPTEVCVFSCRRNNGPRPLNFDVDSVKPDLPSSEAEWLLRIALFDDHLQLRGSQQARDSLVACRRGLARDLREGRKKGVIPVFVSFLWFVFALGLSIELAYDDIGGNATAHNLAMGLLVGWLPVLVVASTVDRNSVSADSVREKLNSLVSEVRCALIHSETLSMYRTATNSSELDVAWIETLKETDSFNDDFFQTFAGQGRTHFHYGVAHPVLSGIETKFIAQYGRGWLKYSAAARKALTVTSRNANGLKTFDPRMALQVISATILFCGSTFGSFFISCAPPCNF